VSRIDLYTILLLPLLYGVWHTNERSEGGGVYCPIVVHQSCTRVGNADGEGQSKDDSLLHTSFEVNEYLVKAKSRKTAAAASEPCGPHRIGLTRTSIRVNPDSG